MNNKSWMSGGSGRAVAGAVVAVVLVVLGFVLSGKLYPPEVPPVEQAAVQAPSTPTAAAPPAPAQTPAPETAPEVTTTADAEPVPADAEPALADAEPAPAQAAPAQAPEAATAPADAPADQAAPTETVVAPAPEPATTAPETAATETVTPDAAAPETAAADAAAPETADDTSQPPAEQDAGASTGADGAAVILPQFDTVRLAPDGEALVAGRAVPGRTVEVLLDGVVVGDAMVGGDGAFVAFLSLPPSDAPRVMTLAVGQGANRLLSDQQVIIAPVAGLPPVAVADAGTTDGAAPADASASAPAAAPTAPPAAPAAPALLLADGTGVRVLQPATPVDPAAGGVGLAIDVISYTTEGDVLLQGRGRPDATILIYLDNAAVTSVPIGSDGIWSTGLPGVAPGIYTLRLDEVNAAGRVLARIETPFKREDRDEVAAIANAGNAASVPADTSAPAGSSTPTAPSDTAAADNGTAQPADAPGSAAVKVVTAQPGNTLWAIARESYGEGLLFVRLFEANRDRIRDPDLIYPGQIFTIPD